MRKKLTYFSVVLLGMLTFYSCYYDIEEELYPSESVLCDTLNLTYQNDVLPIIKQNCYTCHSFAAFSVSGGGIYLEGYNQLKLYADNGQLMNAINHTGGVSPMPKDAAMLSSCYRAVISRWVLNNSPQ